MEYDDAIAALDKSVAAATSTSEYLDAQLALGDVLLRSGDRTRSRAVFKDAASRAEEAADWNRYADAALGYAGPIEVTLDQEPTAVMLERALERVPGGRSNPTWARLTARLGILLGNLELTSRVVALVEDAIAAAEETGDLAAQLFARRAGQFVLAGDPAALLAGARAIAELADRLGDREQIGFAYGWLTSCLFNVADVEGAIGALSRLEQTIHWKGDAFHRDTARMWRSTIALLDGHLDAAEELIDEATIDRDSHGTESQMRSLQLIPLRIEQERVAEIADDVDRNLSKAAAVTWHAFGTLVRAECGDLEGAARLAGSLLMRGGSIVPPDPHRSAALAALGRACITARPADAAAVYERLLPFAGTACATSGFCWMGLADRNLGALAVAMGDAETAERHLRAAVEQAAERRLPFEEGWARLELGSLLFGDADRREEGLRDILRAVDTGRRYVLPRLTRRALELLGGPAPAHPDAWAALSPREVDVARLVAEGFSNQEIAAALHLSALTVESQLKRIFAKLGIKARAALASEFVRRERSRKP